MTAPVHPQYSTEWFAKWTHNYFKLMDLKGSSIVMSSTLPVARLILGSQFSGCCHGEMWTMSITFCFYELMRVAKHTNDVPAAQRSLAGHLNLRGQKSWNQVFGKDLGACVLAVAEQNKFRRWRWLCSEVWGAQVWAHLCLLLAHHSLPLGGAAGTQLAGTLQRALLHNQLMLFNFSLFATRESRLWTREC